MRLIRLVYVFHEKDEAETFYNKVYIKNKVKKIRLQLGEGRSYFIKVEVNQEQFFSYWKDVVQALIHVFILFRLPVLARGILKSHYYYSDKHEIEHIIPILQSVMQNPKRYGTQSDIQTACEFYHMFEKDIKKDSILYFDKFMDEQKDIYSSQLVDVAGYAIDEWKREEDYQEFIHSLRHYIKGKMPRLDTLFITYDGELQFFKTSGKRFSMSELKTLQNEETLHFIDLLSTDFPMSSLVAIAPKQIYIFTNKPSDPKIITLQNLYQEHATIYPLRKFPFIGKKA
jgi:putative sporulation protein YtxC